MDAILAAATLALSVLLGSAAAVRASHIPLERASPLAAIFLGLSGALRSIGRRHGQGRG